MTNRQIITPPRTFRVQRHLCPLRRHPVPQKEYRWDLRLHRQMVRLLVLPLVLSRRLWNRS